MADGFIATEGVKVVKDSASLWLQTITAVSAIGAALGGVGLTHHFTRRREERADAAKLESERLYISTELVFLLEKFAESCADVAADTGRIITILSPSVSLRLIGCYRRLEGAPATHYVSHS